ncbi:hypothetical protein GF323_07150 [Candidatus Woesearchaeota archaeon]|nr:hypothetical protein [Candidatus Woesearchaeota archaeon]
MKFHPLLYAGLGFLAAGFFGSNQYGMQDYRVQGLLHRNTYKYFISINKYA